MRTTHIFVSIFLSFLASFSAHAKETIWPRYINWVIIHPTGGHSETDFSAYFYMNMRMSSLGNETLINNGRYEVPAKVWVDEKRVEGDLKEFANEQDLVAYAKQQYCSLIGQEMEFPRTVKFSQPEMGDGFLVARPVRKTVLSFDVSSNDEPVYNGINQLHRVTCN